MTLRTGPYRMLAPGALPAKPALAPRPVDPYALAWQRLLRRRLLLFASTLACAPALALATGYLGERWPAAATWALPATPALPVLATLALLRLTLFLCPRCRDLFFVRKVLPPAALPDLFHMWHCPHCHVRTGTPRPARAASPAPSEPSGVVSARSGDGRGPRCPSTGAASASPGGTTVAASTETAPEGGRACSCSFPPPPIPRTTAPLAASGPADPC